MVILTHILKSSLSNTQTSLTLIIEDDRFTGLGKLFWLNCIRGLVSEKQVLISDPCLSFPSALPIFPPNPFSESTLLSKEILCIDSLEYLSWLLGKSETFSMIKSRVDQGLGTIAVINKSFFTNGMTEKYCSLAEIITVICKFSKGRGVAQCTHIRGFIKNSQETTEFEVISDQVKEAKSQIKKKNQAPSTTFRIDLNEEEKKMKDITPLPYEKVGKLIQIADEDCISPDEEGDEDDFY